MSGPGPNDAAMQEPSNPISDGFNWVIGKGMNALGYSTERRDVQGGPDDNPFYRDNAQYMPGWSMPGSGLPSGAYAQDRATNYVGHPTGDYQHDTVWDSVRRSLVQQEGQKIKDRQAAGESGQLSFMDLYNAHENAYDHSYDQVDNRGKQGHNGFIDPASFGLAVYGAPALEALGINSGPITGASIDLFNDPTDSATGGWLKRMGLSAGEFGAGAMAMASGHPLLGAGLMGLGTFSALWNTGSAINHGMLGEIGTGIANGASSLVHGAGNFLGKAGSGIANGTSSLVHGAGNLLGRAGTGIANGASSLVHGAGNLVGNAGRSLSGGVSRIFHGLFD